MARINRIVFVGVQARDLSRHLRANGCKVAIHDNGVITTRSDKTAEQLTMLAQQLKGCTVDVMFVG